MFQFHINALSALARLQLLNVLFSTPRSLNPRRLEIILDLELVVICHHPPRGSGSLLDSDGKGFP
ncbi:MAG: hypothetical protein EHM79_14020 [Geobacter sp.]|nr:MAG: hypothetical protein EHM79_14020 [Geobacter sp.]